MQTFLSLQGFDYLFEQSNKHHISKSHLKDLVNSLYTDFSSNFSLEEENSGGKIKSLIKHAQYYGILQIIERLEVNGNILEVGCGNGNLSCLLAENYDANVLGVDFNSDLIDSVRKTRKKENLDFQCLDSFSYNPEGDWNLVVGLHCCGNLSDKVIDTGVENKANIVCVPCCYGKINQEQGILPRSRELSGRVKELGYLIERTRSLEGYVNRGKQLRPNILLELNRRLVDFDRIFYLKENGYGTSFVKITEDRVFSNGKKHVASPLRTAIVGKKL
tara:strand:- start:3577 stop:4401 length:825 start_codon:yes stop_codon:yes gene_type:complete